MEIAHPEQGNRDYVKMRYRKPRPAQREQATGLYQSLTARLPVCSVYVQPTGLKVMYALWGV